MFRSYDTRGQSHLDARHWSDENILGGRAFFRGDQNPARLVLDNVTPVDGGVYRCVAANSHGQVEREFHVDIVHRVAARPPVIRNGELNARKEKLSHQLCLL